MDLSEEQRQAIRPILKEHFDRVREIKRTMRYGIRLERDSLRSLLDDHLSQEEIDLMLRQPWMRGPHKFEHGHKPRRHRGPHGPTSAAPPSRKRQHPQKD